MKEDYKEMVNDLIGSSLEICRHEYDGIESEYWYIRGGCIEFVAAFDTKEKAVEEYNKLKKLIDAEVERREEIS